MWHRHPGGGQDTRWLVRLFVDVEREIVRYTPALVPGFDGAARRLQVTAVDPKEFERYDPSLSDGPWRFATYLSIFGRGSMEKGPCAWGKAPGDPRQLFAQGYERCTTFRV